MRPIPQTIVHHSTKLQDKRESIDSLEKCKRFINTDLNEYLASHSNNCMGCRICLKQEHKTISYKYPKTLNTRYVEQFPATVNEMFNTPNQNFNYDMIRQKLKE